MKIILFTSFHLKGTVHFEFTAQGLTVNQTYCVEILKQLCGAVHRDRHEIWPNDGIFHHDNAPVRKALSVKQFLFQK